MNYTVNTTEAKKVSVTITRRQLWDNYVDCWRDIAWDGEPMIEPMIDSLKNVHSVLVTDYELNFNDLRKLFRSGDTVMLMGDAMQFLDAKDILREVVVLDERDKYNKVIHIRHEDIIF
jgi:hypothetical protein